MYETKGTLVTLLLLFFTLYQVVELTLFNGPLQGNLTGNVVMSSVTGYRAVLSCLNQSSETHILVLWKIRLRDGAHCTLAYRTDLNKTDRTNCSKRMDWVASPDHDTAIQIHPVRLSDEGHYRCEIASTDENFHQNYILSVLVTPEVTLTLDIHGRPLCKASTGKPAAQISWLPAGDHRTEFETHTNRTVTVFSVYEVHNIPKKTICFVSHPTWNTSQSIEFPSEEAGFSHLLHYLLIGGTISCIVIVTVLYCTLQHRAPALLTFGFCTNKRTNMSLKSMAAPDNPNVHSTDTSGVSCNDRPDDIYQN